MGFSQEIIKQYGTTSENIIFSSISSFDKIVFNLFDLILDRNLHYKIMRDDKDKESPDDILANGCKIIKNVIDITIKDLTDVAFETEGTYLQNANLFANLNRLCK